MATEYYTGENGVEVWNESGVASDSVIRGLQSEAMVAALGRWMVDTSGRFRSKGNRSMIDRDRFVCPSNIYEQFRVARDAVETDDTVGGWMETTENLMFEDVGFDCDNTYEQDIWNQIAENIELEERMREAYRSFGTFSQVYPFVWWGRDDFKVRDAKSDTGKAAKKTFPNLTVPGGINFLDPMKVLPVGNLMFNQEGLAYIADISEVDALDAACLGDPAADPLASALVVRKYTPDVRERRLFGEFGVDTTRLYLLNPRNVFRITATRSQHERFAALRMKPVLELLDMKHQLREMDRAFLIGGLNFILVVTQGSDKAPGTSAEVAKLGMSVRTLGRVPLLIGDQRLDVKIVAPPQDHTLDIDKYQTLNAPIVSYLYRMVMISYQGARGDDQLKAAKIVGRGLQALRKRLAKKFERNIFQRVWKENDQLTNPATLKFWPRRVELDFDPALAQLMVDIYDHRDISRDTLLSFVDIDQEQEARKKKYEKESGLDDTFGTIVPFNGPTDPNAPKPDPKSSGRRQGGNRSGGGRADGTGQGKPAKTPGRTSTQRRAAAVETDVDDGTDAE